MERNQPVAHKVDLQTILDGVGLIFSHFTCQPPFPRRIYTPIHRQVVVYNLKEVIKYFREANFVDCRISAYTFREKHFSVILGEYPPDIIFMDLDESGRSARSLDSALLKTVKNIRERLCCDTASPTVLASGGGGYHIIQPLNAIDLTRFELFNKWSEDANREFLQFLEPYLSNNRADPNHYHTVSYNNYLLRVPGSINSKTGLEVKTTCKWNGVRPEIKYVYGDFLAYLVDRRQEEECAVEQRRKNCVRQSYPQKVHQVDWIEKLIKKGITDFRKDCIRIIIAPYLIQSRRLPYDEALRIISNWLDICNLRQSLSCSKRDYLNKIKDTVRLGFFYSTPYRIRIQNHLLYELLVEENLIVSCDYK